MGTDRGTASSIDDEFMFLSPPARLILLDSIKTEAGDISTTYALPTSLEPARSVPSR
jgi:hypothetical protein